MENNPVRAENRRVEFFSRPPKPVMKAIVGGRAANRRVEFFFRPPAQQQK